MMGRVERAILGLVPADGITLGDLHTKVGVALGRPTASAEFEAALTSLETLGAIACSQTRVRRSQPDAPEASLEADTLAWLERSSSLGQLGFRQRVLAIKRTATGGVGAGAYSHPDFTVVLAQRSPTYPVTVVTLELKNQVGTNAAAVMQAHAYLRFSHCAILVCPRPQFWRRDAYDPRRDCTRERVGLVTFKIAAAPVQRRALAFQVKQTAPRQRPEPAEITRYLRDKLPAVLEQIERAGDRR